MEETIPPGPIVIKIGGSTLGNHDTSLKDLVYLHKQGLKLVVVHGGGQIISQWIKQQGIIPNFIKGLRVTDLQNLDIATAVLTGLVNKQLVASLIKLGGSVMGFSGIDDHMLECRMADKNLGYVGTIIKVNPAPINHALSNNYIPIVAPMGIHQVDESQNSGHILNINGDTATGEIAFSLGASKVIFLTDVTGVIDRSGNVVKNINAQQARMLIRSGTAKGGMIPKLEACLTALPRVPEVEIIDGRVPEALRASIAGKTPGTRIQA
jgi:acetylglutamate kinase